MKPEKQILKALKAVTDENSEMTLEERFDDLGQTIIANSFKILSGAVEDDEAEARQKEMVRQFKIIAATMKTLKSAGRISGTPNSKFDEQLMKKIKEQRSTVGHVVRDMKERNGNL